MKLRIPTASPFLSLLLSLGLLAVGAASRSSMAAESAARAAWDNCADTWVATDALGRTVPLFPEVSGPRADRTVGMFYFLWLGAHARGGPFDVAQILQTDPDAMTK